MTRSEGRLHRPRLTAAIIDAADARQHVCAPGVGLWRPTATVGQIVRAGDEIGVLTVLGMVFRVVAGNRARGAVMVATGASRADTPVDHGAMLYTLDPNSGIALETAAGSAVAIAEAMLVFRAPSSGRFYSRPAPGRPAFVVTGDIVRAGQTVCMLEVMKTFHRVTYGGSGLPEEARVVAIAVADESDVEPGAALLRLEAVT